MVHPTGLEYVRRQRDGLVEHVVRPRSRGKTPRASTVAPAAANAASAASAASAAGAAGAAAAASAAAAAAAGDQDQEPRTASPAEAAEGRSQPPRALSNSAGDAQRPARPPSPRSTSGNTLLLVATLVVVPAAALAYRYRHSLACWATGWGWDLANGWDSRRDWHSSPDGDAWDWAKAWSLEPHAPASPRLPLPLRRLLCAAAHACDALRAVAAALLASWDARTSWLTWRPMWLEYTCGATCAVSRLSAALAHSHHGTLAPLAAALAVDPAHRRAAYSAAALVLAVLLLSCFQLELDSQSLTALPGLGIQLARMRSLTFGLPGLRRRTLATRATRAFVPLEEIHSVVIHEALRRWNVVYYLGIVLDGRVVVAFEDVRPRLEVLIQVYHAVQDELFAHPPRNGGSETEIADMANGPSGAQDA